MIEPPVFYEISILTEGVLDNKTALLSHSLNMNPLCRKFRSRVRLVPSSFEREKELCDW